eukprot:RCo048257
MGERKVLNKYYPPDFDPTRLPKQEGHKIGHRVRMMMPMSVQCNTCGEFIYNGKKFNSTIEPTDEKYLNIRIWRLVVRCPRCLAPISLRTDPQNCDYVCEAGASRNFEPWREFNMDQAQKDAEREQARRDVMKELEEKQYDAQREIDALNQLDELRASNARRAVLTPEDLLSAIVSEDPEEVRAAEE